MTKPAFGTNGVLALVLVRLLAPGPALVAQPATWDLFAERIDTLHDELVAVRRDLHRHPEVSGEEERTAGIVAERLRALGFALRTGVGGHGVVARIDGARPGPVVAFRADMDAVYSPAPDPVDFRSENPSVRHICGHDIHTTVGLALAEGLAAIRDRMSGSVVLIFQPAEERATGARAMIADGALDPHDPIAVFALHTAPMNVGQLAVVPGVMMSWRDRVRIRVTGDGDLEGIARQARAAVLATATLTPAQGLSSSPTPEFAFPQMAMPTADGGAWTVSGSLSTGSRKTSAAARGQIASALDALGSEGIEIALDYEERWIAGVDNDAELTRRATASVENVLGEGSVLPTGGIVPAFSEDFGSFQERVPGVMFFLGVSNPEKGIVGMPHSPGYVADEDAIAVGAKAMGSVILDVLDAPPAA